MEKSEYRKLFDLEDSHWWYRGLHDLVLSFFGTEEMPTERILDAGCGTGGMISLLQNHHSTYGIDISSTAVEFCKQRQIKNVVRASIAHIPFPESSFHWVISTDVLYHKFVEEETRVLKEFHRVLKTDGKLLLNLPAYSFLQSSHDIAIHTRRRYTKKNVALLLREASFKILRITYHNSFLFPLILMHRITRNFFHLKASESDLRPVSRLLNQLLHQVSIFENRFVRKWDLPFGSSVFCIARKSNCSKLHPATV